MFAGFFAMVIEMVVSLLVNEMQDFGGHVILLKILLHFLTLIIEVSLDNRGWPYLFTLALIIEKFPKIT